MKTKAITLVFMLLIGALTNSCKKDSTNLPDDDDGNSVPVDVKLKDAQVILPAGSTYDLNGHELFAGGVIQPVDKDGKTKVIQKDGQIGIAYLFDKDDNPVMAGFITDSTQTISVASTAKVLLYYVLGTAFQPDTLHGVFVNNIDKIPAVSDWVSAFTAAWSNNPKGLSSGSFVPALKQWMSNNETAMGLSAPVPTSLSMSTRASSIRVDANDIRSGLRLHAEDLGLSVTNHYRRAVVGFAYKMKSKKEGEQHFRDILPRLEASTDPDVDFWVDPVSGVTSFTGTVYNNIQGKGLEANMITSDPVSLDLDEDETEAYYKVRLIGLGAGTKISLSEEMEENGLTKKELTAFCGVFAYHFINDFFVPLVGGFYKAGGSLQEDGMVELFGDLVLNTPKVMENMVKGDFSGAFIATLDAMVATQGQTLLVMLLKKALPDAQGKIEDVAKKLTRVFLVTDLILQGTDWARVSYHWYHSKGLEEWEVLARRSKVTLTPGEAAVSTSGASSRQEISAEIKDLDEKDKGKDRSYEWTTTGKYSTLSDSKGNAGKTFRSADSKIVFQGMQTSALTDGENWEQVYVAVYIDDKLIGRDTANVRVNKSAYQIGPEATVSGRKGSENKVTLFIRPINRNMVRIENDPENDYRISWSTAGKYGALSGDGTSHVKTLSTTANSIVYECVDNETKSGTEYISATIYVKPKGQPDSEYQLFERLEGKVFIVNDETKKIIYVPISVISWGPTDDGVYTSCGAGTIFYVDPVENAVSYSARVIEFSPEVIPRVTGTGASWTAATGQLNADGQYEFGYVLATSGWSPTWIGPPDCAKFIAGAASRTGMAQVIVTLKP
ncbi:hypothetical protein [Parapedobacter soli]|uniref:hypothetical protein n=1 Tax=Parapedobacter soli TaxID=416955 RepID=UPI0021C651EA|nr:hypothetical protein [Parapedobacter soli]